MDITVYRANEYDQQMSVTGVDDGTSWKLYWSWRKATRAADVIYEKTVVQAAGEINVELSATEADQLPFVDGYLGVFKIDSVTGRKIRYATYSVRVEDDPAGADYTVTSNVSIAVPWLYSMEGGNQVGTLQGYYTASADGVLSSIVVGVQDVAVGQSIIFDVYVNGEATGDTITLAIADSRNTATLTTTVSQDDYVEVKISQASDIGSGTNPWCILNYQKS